MRITSLHEIGPLALCDGIIILVLRLALLLDLARQLHTIDNGLESVERRLLREREPVQRLDGHILLVGKVLPQLHIRGQIEQLGIDLDPLQRHCDALVRAADQAHNWRHHGLLTCTRTGGSLGL